MSNFEPGIRNPGLILDTPDVQPVYGPKLSKKLVWQCFMFKDSIKRRNKTGEGLRRSKQRPSSRFAYANSARLFLPKSNKSGPDHGPD